MWRNWSGLYFDAAQLSSRLSARRGSFACVEGLGGGPGRPCRLFCIIIAQLLYAALPHNCQLATADSHECVFATRVATSPLAWPVKLFRHHRAELRASWESRSRGCALRR